MWGSESSNCTSESDLVDFIGLQLVYLLVLNRESAEASAKPQQEL